MSMKPSMFHSMGINMAYSPLFVWPLAFLYFTFYSSYISLKFCPPLLKALDVEPIMHLPIILLPKRKQVLVTRQFSLMFTGLVHLPDSSWARNNSFSPSYELSSVFFQSMVVSRPSISVSSDSYIFFFVILEAGTLNANSVFGLSIHP